MKEEIIDSERQKVHHRKLLNTSGCCFLCLKVTDFKNDRNSIIKDSDAVKTLNSTKESVSLKYIFCHLQIDISKLSDKIRQPENKGANCFSEEDLEVTLCKDCSKIFNIFSKLASTMEKIEMELNYWMKEMHRRIPNGSSLPELIQNYSKRMTSDPETLAYLPLVDTLRKEIERRSRTSFQSGRRASVFKELNVILSRSKAAEAMLTNPLNIEQGLEEDPVVGTEAPFETEFEDDLPISTEEDYEDIKSLAMANSSADAFTVIPSHPAKILSSRSPPPAKTQTTGLKTSIITKRMKLKCDICNVAAYYHKQHLLRHQRTCQHNLQCRLNEQILRKQDPSFKFACKTCNKRFKQRNKLKIHEKTVHMNRKDHVCDICKKEFKHLANLKEHTDRVHLGKIFTCKFCGKTFSFRNAYQVHGRKCTKRIKLEPKTS